MNRNVLKIIAVITMLIDHVGAHLFPNITILRWIGRLAFPIFAYFIAEGMKYTRSRTKYVLLLSLCAVVSQVPYGLVFGWKRLNIIFTFLISILMIYLLETYKKHELLKMISLIILSVLLCLCDLFGVVDYGVFGVLLVLVFYFIKDKNLSLCLGAACLTFITLRNCLFSGFTVETIKQMASLLAIPVLYFYNNQKGRVNLKYLFYSFYPLHLLAIYLIGIII